MLNKQFTPSVILVNQVEYAILPFTNRYAVSKNGEIISSNSGTWKVMKSPTGKNGYQTVSITYPIILKSIIPVPNSNPDSKSPAIVSKNVFQKTYAVHRLVYTAWKGPIPIAISGKRLCVDHINSIKNDNRLDNLQLLTWKENLDKGFLDRLKASQVNL